MPILRIQKVVVTAARFLISTKLHCVVQTSVILNFRAVKPPDITSLRVNFKGVKQMNECGGYLIFQRSVKSICESNISQ